MSHRKMKMNTKNHKNDCHDSTIQPRDLQPKLNMTKFGSIFNFNMLLVILDGSHYRKSQKWLS